MHAVSICIISRGNPLSAHGGLSFQEEPSVEFKPLRRHGAHSYQNGILKSLPEEVRDVRRSAAYRSELAFTKETVLRWICSTPKFR